MSLYPFLAIRCSCLLIEFYYKDNFIYDENVISEALKYVKEISQKISVNEFEICFGLQLDNNFAFDFHYGKFKKGDIIKNEE